MQDLTSNAPVHRAHGEVWQQLESLPALHLVLESPLSSRHERNPPHTSVTSPDFYERFACHLVTATGLCTNPGMDAK